MAQRSELRGREQRRHLQFEVKSVKLIFECRIVSEVGNGNCQTVSRAYLSLLAKEYGICFMVVCFSVATELLRLRKEE